MRSAGATVPRTGPLERNPWGAASTTGADDTCQRAVMENRQPDWCSLPPYQLQDFNHRISAPGFSCATSTRCNVLASANPFGSAPHPLLLPLIVVMLICGLHFPPKRTVLQPAPHSVGPGGDLNLYILCNNCWASTKPYEHLILSHPYILRIQGSLHSDTLPCPFK